MSTEPRPDWAAIERMPEFRALVRAKRAFIIPACVFFVAYYFALPALVGYWPDLMSTRVAGRINLAYLFALSQFVMAWGLMAAYIRRAQVFDRMVDDLLRQVRHASSAGPGAPAPRRSAGRPEPESKGASERAGESEGPSPSAENGGRR